MARVVYIDEIDTLRGALDTWKEGQAKRERLVSKFCDYGEKSYTKDGKKIHIVYKYHFHEGPWSDGATRNREMIKVAQRMAHAIQGVSLHPEGNSEDDIAMAKLWEQQYAKYRANPPKVGKVYKRFFTWMYTKIYRGMRVEAGME